MERAIGSLIEAGLFHEDAFHPESTPLLAAVTHRGHQLSASDDDNFEFGLQCLLGRARRLIEQNAKPSSTASKAPARRR